MKEIYDGPELTALAEKLRKELAKNFGVTVVGNHVTLRKEIDGVHTEFALLLGSAFLSVPTCENCGEDLRGASQHKATETTKLCVSELKREIILCYDCYCPK